MLGLEAHMDLFDTNSLLRATQNLQLQVMLGCSVTKTGRGRLQVDCKRAVDVAAVSHRGTWPVASI